MSNKSSRNILLAKRYSHKSSNSNSTQGSKQQIPIHTNVNTSVKRSYEVNPDNSDEQPSAKKSKIRNDLSHHRSSIQSSSKNIANKRLQDLRRSLEEKRSQVEQQLNNRLNKTIGSNVLNTTIIDDKSTKQGELNERPRSSTIQSRLQSYTSLVDHKHSNCTITASNVNTINEKIVMDEEVKLRSETKQSSSKLCFMPSSNSCDKSTNMDDAMEWESVDEATVLNNINEIRKEITYDKKLPIDDILNINNPITTSRNGVFIVVDTNIFLSQLNILVQLKKMEFKGFGRAAIFIPWMVIQELDYMKESKSCHLNKNARKAVSYINEQLMKNDPFFKGQTVLEASKQELCSNNADDGILHCCMQLAVDKKYVILLSNDINLRNKVLVNKIQAYNSDELINTLEKLNISMNSNDNANDNTLKINVDKIKIILSNLLTHVVESEMRKAYNDIWLKMVKSNPPFTIDEALNLMCKYWISVFSFSLQKQAKQKIEEFLLFLKHNLKADTYTQHLYHKFTEHSLTLCIYLKNAYPCYKFHIMDCISNIQKCAEP